MKFEGGLSGRLLGLVAFQGNVGLWNAVLEELQPTKASAWGYENCEPWQQHPCSHALYRVRCPCTRTRVCHMFVFRGLCLE